MNFATGNGANNNWQAEDGAASLSDTSAESPLLAGLTDEYSLLAGVTANMRTGFILLNRRERITYSNPSAQHLLGVNSQDVLTQPIFDVRKQLLSMAVDPVHAQAELERIWCNPEQECSTDLALADAAVRWLRVHSFPVRDAPGHLLGRGVLLDDITLERSSIQARSETLALAAHELKTPLAIIKGCATTLLGSSMRWDPAMQREMLQMIDTHADRLHDVLNTLLDVWRLDAGAQNLKLSQIQIAELLSQLVVRWQQNTSPPRDAINRVPTSAPLDIRSTPRHHFVLHTPGYSLPSVLCDALRLEQALNHLLENAVIYSPEGGTITLQLDSNAVEMRLSITDEGIGIASEYLDSIFDRFYRIQRGEESSKGSGLGLAIARATIEAHGGRIWADSPGSGQGATFYCILPFAPRLPTQQRYVGSATTYAPFPPISQRSGSTSFRGNIMDSPTPRDAKELKGAPQAPLRVPTESRCHVLLVENDARMVRYLRAHLEEQRYRVQTLNHGAQFLRSLDLEEPDVVILATQLADISGIELLQRVREFSQMPVLMLCDACTEDERVRFFDLGADEVITKPFSVKELLARLRALVRRSSTSSTQPISQTIFTTGELTIDYTQHQVSLQGHTVQLSRTEYKLLSILAQNAGMVLTHELLLERVWGPGYNRDVDFIWVYISRLRRKIEADSRHPRYILTVPDVGYKLAKL